MNFDDFQRQSGALAAKGPGGVQRFQWTSKGLISSAGKIDRCLLNCAFDDLSLLDDDNAKKIAEEIGFVLWHCSVLADALDRRLDSIAQNHLQAMAAMLDTREEK